MLILIAGITGLCGRACARATLKAGHQARGLARNPHKLDNTITERLESFVKMSDIYDIPALDKAVASVDAVISTDISRVSLPDDEDDEARKYWKNAREQLQRALAGFESLGYLEKRVNPVDDIPNRWMADTESMLAVVEQKLQLLEQRAVGETEEEYATDGDATERYGQVHASTKRLTAPAATKNTVKYAASQDWLQHLSVRLDLELSCHQLLATCKRREGLYDATAMVAVLQHLEEVKSQRRSLHKQAGVMDIADGSLEYWTTDLFNDVTGGMESIGKPTVTDTATG
ncbi:hypothetical protein QQX98_005887 [Neonectria punicea]|uniref:NAD(P)-binding domain-containing protein n=1 Tax=Neonectria punicea TaxID=979145 RepID=A0ABR1H2X2_9HYPO